MSNEVNCPFCNAEGFDLIGLKDHLQYRCDKYDETISVAEESRLRQLSKRRKSCKGIEIEPGVFSGCDAKLTGARDCPVCGKDYL